MTSSEMSVHSKYEYAKDASNTDSWALANKLKHPTNKEIKILEDLY